MFYAILFIVWMLVGFLSFAQYTKEYKDGIWLMPLCGFAALGGPLWIPFVLVARKRNKS